MTLVRAQAAVRKAPLLDRLFVSGCTLAYLGLLASVAFALRVW